MFSLSSFYSIVHNNLISKLPNGNSVYWSPFGTYDRQVLCLKGINKTDQPTVHLERTQRLLTLALFFDQEPLYEHTLPDLFYAAASGHDHVRKGEQDYNKTILPRRLLLLANSEKSQFKKDFCRSREVHDWYYFFHGFAALDWYRDFQYADSTLFEIGRAHV